jgi:hypothetical protein
VQECAWQAQPFHPAFVLTGPLAWNALGFLVVVVVFLVGFILLLWWCLGLNSGPCICKAGTLHLGHSPYSPFCFRYFFGQGLLFMLTPV